MYGVLLKTYVLSRCWGVTPTRVQARLNIDHDKLWVATEVDAQLGMCCENYKWQQNQSHVEVYIHVPEQTTSKQVCHIPSLPPSPQEQPVVVASSGLSLVKPIRSVGHSWS